MEVASCSPAGVPAKLALVNTLPVTSNAEPVLLSGRKIQCKTLCKYHRKITLFKKMCSLHMKVKVKLKESKNVNALSITQLQFPVLWICAHTTSPPTASRSPGITQPVTSSSTDSHGHRSQVATRRRSVSIKYGRSRQFSVGVKRRNVTVFTQMIDQHQKMNYLHGPLTFRFCLGSTYYLQRKQWLHSMWPDRESVLYRLHISLTTAVAGKAPGMAEYK